VRALLDTNILIHREAFVVVQEEIGLIFNWFDQLKGAYVLSKDLRAKKDRRICAKTVRSGRIQSTGWNIEVRYPLEGTAGEEAGRPAECNVLIEDVSASPYRHFTCKRAPVLLIPCIRPIS
jgi:hypothetical protein